MKSVKMDIDETIRAEVTRGTFALGKLADVLEVRQLRRVVDRELLLIRGAIHGAARREAFGE